MNDIEIPEAEQKLDIAKIVLFTLAAEVSSGVRETLAKKAEEHNAKHGSNSCKKTSTRTLIAVFKRGIGAYKTNPESVRPNVTGPEQWGYGRVNGFLHALRTGSFKRKAFDVDLLPSCHPQKKKKS